MGLGFTTHRCYVESHVQWKPGSVSPPSVSWAGLPASCWTIPPCFPVEKAGHPWGHGLSDWVDEYSQQATGAQPTVTGVRVRPTSGPRQVSQYLLASELLRKIQTLDVMLGVSF